MSRSRKNLFRLLAMGLACAVAVGMVEIYLRVSLKPVDLMQLTGQRDGPNPMAKWAVVDAFAAYRAIPGSYGLNAVKVRKTVNRHGFISTPELDFEKPAGTVRVAFLGGSSVAGTGINVADEQTWPWLVAERLRAGWPGKRVEFINAALGGYTTFESFGRLWARVRPFDVDVVVLYQGWNDIAYFHDADETNAYRTLADGSWGFGGTVKAKTLKPMAIDGLLGWSQVYCRVRELTGERYGEAGRRGDAERAAATVDPASVAVFTQNLQLIREACAVMGAELFVAKQAEMVTGDGPGAKDVSHLRALSKEALKRAYDAIYAAIDEQIGEQHVIDVTVLSGEGALFYDHVHPNPAGTERIAEIVAGAILERSEVGGEEGR